jgi:hypothetical protein
MVDDEPRTAPIVPEESGRVLAVGFPTRSSGKMRWKEGMAELTCRRAEPRFSVNADASCPFVSPVVKDFGPVRIRDISMASVGLLLSRRVEPGTTLAVTLCNPARGFTKTVLVQVTHATLRDGACLVAGTFTVPLTYQEMTAFVL